MGFLNSVVLARGEPLVLIFNQSLLQVSRLRELQGLTTRLQEEDQEDLGKEAVMAIIE